MSNSTPNQQSFELGFISPNPSELAEQILASLYRGKMTPEELSSQLSEDTRLCSSLIVGTSSLVRNLVDKTGSSSKDYAFFLAMNIQPTLSSLTQVGNALKSDSAKLQFAEILLSLSKEYFEALKALSDDSNSVLKYAMSGLIALGIALIGGKEFFEKPKKMTDINPRK